MKKTPLITNRLFARIIVLAFVLSRIEAGTFSTDFNAGVPPAGMTLYGTALSYDDSTGGITNSSGMSSGVLKLTDTTGSQQGGAIIDDFDSGATIGGFDATFQLYIGSGTGADGMSFFFGDFNDAAYGEEGPGTINGLTISFDVFNNGGTPPEAPAIDVKWNAVVLVHRLVGTASTTTGASPIGSATTIRTQITAGGAPVYVPVKIHVDTDGTLDLVFNNVVVFTNLPVFHPITNLTINPAVPNARFGFGARTGGSTDNHWIDNLTITTLPPDANSGQPYAKTISPVSLANATTGGFASAVGGVLIELQDQTFSVNTNATITMLYNGAAVTPSITRDIDVTRIIYKGPNGLLPVNQGTVTLSYSTTSAPPLTNSFSYSFVVAPVVTLPGGYPIASVDTSKPGFNVRVHQMDTIRAPGDRNLIVAAERELANGYIDASTGQPYPNTADLSLTNEPGIFTITDVINWNLGGAAIGNFTVNSTPSRPDLPIPGIPGTAASVPNTEDFAVEITTILQLKAGGHRIGVNSDDGFRASFGPGFDAAGTSVVGNFNGGRGSADTIFDVVAPVDGFYPFRLSYWQGVGGANIELFEVDPNTNQKILINDPDLTSAARAFRASTVSRSFVSRVLPVQDWLFAFPNDDVIIDITDGAIPVDGTSIVLKINGTAQTVTKGKTNNVTTVVRKGSMDNLLPAGANNVNVIFSFTENASTVTLTNSYTFTVAPYYNVLPAANKVSLADVVTADTGFHAVVAQMDKTSNTNQANGGRFPGDQNRMPRPEMQLAQTLLNPTNGLPYPNLANSSATVGANPDGSFDFQLINFNIPNLLDPTTTPGTGLFQAAQPPLPLLGAHADAVMPGLPGAGTSPAPPASPTATTAAQGTENYVMEAVTYLGLKKGIYVFGMNSDDGFVVSSAPNPHDTLGTVLGFFSGGRGNSGNLVGPVNPFVSTPGVNSGSTPFSVIVPEDGIYPFRILYWQGGGGVNAEFFTLDKLTGSVILVNDTATSPSAVPAYRTYTGPARPWVKFSVSPNQWDGRIQQTGPGPIKAVGPTRNDLNNAGDIYNSSEATRPWADVAIGGVLSNLGGGSVSLLLDGTVVPAAVTPSGGDTIVSYKPPSPLPSGTTHTASLVYTGTTNSWTFTVQTYTNLNASDAVQASQADPNSRGFRVKMTQVAGTTGFTQNSVARAEAQLAGILSPDVSVPGPGANGTYLYTNIINWNNNVNPNHAGVQLGNFQANNYGAGTGWPYPFYADERIPGVPNTTTNAANANTDNLAAEIFAYLSFTNAGYYKFGVNSDDGFKLQVGTPGQTNGTVIFSIDVGKGASDIPVSFTIPQAGLYPIRLVYYNGGGGAALEYFSYDDTGNKIPINDTNNPAAIKAYYNIIATPALQFTSATVSGGAATFTWTGTAILQQATVLTGSPSDWSAVSPHPSGNTYQVQVSSATQMFYRLKQ